MGKKLDKFIDRSKTNAEKYILREELFGTVDLLPMWVADMDIATPSCVFKDIKKRLKHPILGYEEFPQSAKKAQSLWLEKKHQINIDTDDIVYSPSVITSINIAIKAFTNIGDEVIVQPPVYFPFFTSIKNNNRKIIYNPLKKDDNGIYTFDTDDLVSKITPKTKLLLLCSPHNPVGRVYTKDELKQLADICIKYNIVIFEDSIHSDIVYKGYKYIPISSINKDIEKLTLTAYGVGKTFNLAGIATSTIIIQNEQLKKNYLNVYNSIHFTQGNTLGHIAFESVYTKGEKWQSKSIKHFSKNIDMLYNALLPYNHLITFFKPQGTYLVWLDCSGLNMNDKQLKKFFIEDVKLGLNGGLSFGKSGSKYMRINIAVSRKVLNEAIRRLINALQNYHKEVVS